MHACHWIYAFPLTLGWALLTLPIFTILQYLEKKLTIKDPKDPFLFSLSFVFSKLFSILKYFPKEIQYLDQNTNLKGKIAIVTGSNTGIGKATATCLYRKGCHVILACRNEAKAKDAISSIIQSTKDEEINNINKNSHLHTKKNGNEKNRYPLSSLYPFAKDGKISFAPLDLSELDSVKKFPTYLSKELQINHIDILINNAGLNEQGVTCHDYYEKKGLNYVFAVNYLGHFVLTLRLLPFLEKSRSREPRIVNLASVMHEFGSEHFEESFTSYKQKNFLFDLFDWRSYYSDSKLAMIMFTYELQRRLFLSNNEERRKIRVLSVSPGAVYSDIWRGMNNIFRKFILNPFMSATFLSIEEGCATSVAAATIDYQELNLSSKEKDVDGILKYPPYLQPYYLTPFKLLFPFEILGPYVGYCQVKPRLPKDYKAVAKLLWELSLRYSKEPINSFDFGSKESE